MKFRVLVISGFLAASCAMNVCAENAAPDPKPTISAETEDADPETEEDETIIEETAEWKVNSDLPETEEEKDPGENEIKAGRILDEDTFENRIRAGSYVAGEDLPEGEYILFSYSDDKASVRVGIKEEDSYSMSVDVFPYDYIKVFAEGNDVTLVDCFAVPINSVKPEILDLSGPGMYKTGMHFAAGNYSLVSDDGDGSYKIFSTVSPEKIYREGEVGKNNVSVRLSAGQYILLKNCHFVKTPEAIITTYSDKETILHVQGQLNMIEYDCGKPDGVLGNKTTAAIKKFQEDNDLVVNGKITPELLVVLEEKSPYAEVEAELGPFIIDTEKFLSRYNEAAEGLADKEEDSYASLKERDVKKDKVSPNKNGTYIFGTNHAADKISSAFYVLKGAYDRKSVLELSLLIYGLDASCKDLDTANGIALKLLFDGEVTGGSLEYQIVPMEGSNVAWISVPDKK